MKHTVVWISICAVLLVLGMYTGYRYEKRKLDMMVGFRDVMYTKQISDLEARNAMLLRSALLAKDHYTVQNGSIVLMTEDGSDVKKDVLLDNGNQLTRTGVLVTKDGSRKTLSTGQSIWMDGTIMSPDGTLTIYK